MEKLVYLPIAERALERFGKNIYGEPKYRIIRADTRMDWKDGEFKKKYPGHAGCWILEAWCPPEQYEPRVPFEAAGTLGPFPTRGNYEMSYAFVNKGEGYDPAYDIIQVAVQVIERGKGMSFAARRAQLIQAQEDAKNARKETLRDMVRDAAPLRGGEAERKHEDLVRESTIVRPTVAPGAGLMKGMNS